MLLIKASRLLIPALLALMLVFAGCSDDDETNTPFTPEEEMDLTADCIGCHSNDEMLQATALPDEDPPGDPSGEG